MMRLACSLNIWKLMSNPNVKILVLQLILIPIRKLTNCSFLFVLLHLCLLLPVSLSLLHISPLGLALTHVPCHHHQPVTSLPPPPSCARGVRKRSTHCQATSHPKPNTRMGSLPWTLMAQGRPTWGIKMRPLAADSKLAKGPRCFPSPCSSPNHSPPSSMTMATSLSPTFLKPTSCPRACSTTFPSAPHPCCPVSSSSSSSWFPPPSQCHMPSPSPSLWLCASATWSPRQPP